MPINLYPGNSAYNVTGSVIDYSITTANTTAATTWPWFATATTAASNWITNIQVEWLPHDPLRWRREKLAIARASKRARKTLMRFLDEEQIVAYAKSGRFKVRASNGWLFEIGKGRNPLLLGDDGHADASFCIHPKERFPDEDKILSLMLLLASDVEEFLQIANRTTIRQRPLKPMPPLPAAQLEAAVALAA